MSNKRPVILMAILLALIAGYLAKPWWAPSLYQTAPPLAPRLPGANSISGLWVSQDDQGRWFAEYDYYFTGEPQWIQNRVELLRDAQAPAASVPTDGRLFIYAPAAVRGHHHVKLEISHPAPNVLTTYAIDAQLATGNTRIVAHQLVAQRIEWPDWQTYMAQRETIGKSTGDLVKAAVAEIDAGTDASLDHAKHLLETAISRDPRADTAYVELARVAMKGHWGPDGLHQAEALLSSALQIQPENENAMILVAYVQAHQGRYQEATKLSEQIARGKPGNLWLWANWGEMLEMQGRIPAALDKYHQALSHPPTHDTYDRARLFAYARSLSLLEAGKNYDAMEELYKQRLSDYGNVDCAGAEYARFELLQRADTAAAISMAKQSLQARCEGELSAREVLGMAYYVAWASAPMGVNDDQSLNQARVYLPPGAHALYLLAGSDRTLLAAQRLLSAGESLEEHDNNKMTALAYALVSHDTNGARRLIKLGARPETTVGPADTPAALIPAINGDIPGIRLMQRTGIDYAKLRYQGLTAVEQARRAGRQDLVDILDSKANSL